MYDVLFQYWQSTDSEMNTGLLGRGIPFSALKSEEMFLVLDKQFHLALIAFCVLDLLRMRIVAQEYMLPATHYLLLTLE